MAKVAQPAEWGGKFIILTENPKRDASDAVVDGNGNTRVFDTAEEAQKAIAAIPASKAGK